MSAKTLMIQGCTSDAGKSFIVTGLARLLRRQGLRVAPFKPQNMANNSAVTIDGGEIGRAQAVQAQAAGVEPVTDMNPVLLKPNTDTGAQVVIQGTAIGNMDALEYHQYKKQILPVVMESHSRLAEQYDVVLVEGAGSPAEINLREHDIANMGFAEAVNCPVWLVADIDRGGVFAHLAGTLTLLKDSERARVDALLINRFRGEIELLQPGVRWLHRHTGKPVAGVLPYLDNLHLEAEDSVVLSRTESQPTPDAMLNVVVPVLPRVSNHTDLDPLSLHPQVNVCWIRLGETVPAADLIILPGSKSTRADLERMRHNGWDTVIAKHLRYGGKVIGLCGGYQMLGDVVHDPDGLEGDAGSSAGLGMLRMETRLHRAKQLKQVEGRLTIGDVPVTGYEIHLGDTYGPALENPAVKLDGREDGVVSSDHQILGTYLHGIFDHAAARDALLDWAGLTVKPTPDYRDIRERDIDRLADMMTIALQQDALQRILGLDIGDSREGQLGDVFSS